MKIKGKRLLCTAEVKAFSVHRKDDMSFYMRYADCVNILKQYIHAEDVDIFLAEPKKIDNHFEWFVSDAFGENAKKLSDIEDIKERNIYLTKKNEIVKSLNEAEKQVDNDRKIYICEIKDSIKDQYIYCANGHICLVLWGMDMIKGFDPQIIISNPGVERRLHSVIYSVEGKGFVNGEEEIKISCKHGSELKDKDIPEIQAADRYEFSKWEPDSPYGKKVDKDLYFKAVFIRDNKYYVDFKASEGGTLEGETHFVFNKGDKLSLQIIPKPKALDDYDFKCFKPTPEEGYKIEDDIVYTAIFQRKPHKVHFNIGEQGSTNAPLDIVVEHGKILNKSEIPYITPSEGFCFDGWDKDTKQPITEDVVFNAKYKEKAKTVHNVLFVAGDEGNIPDGLLNLNIEHGNCLSDTDIPPVTEKEGFKFAGWDKDVKSPILQDTTFNAKYTKIRLPWYKRLWAWLWNTKGCLKKLLYLLLIIGLILLLLGLLRSCNGCSKHRPVKPLHEVTTPSGDRVEDNGVIKPITDMDGSLPEGDGIAAPMRDDDWQQPPITQQPGMPNVIANRLILFLTEDNDDVDAFAQDFKKTYTSDKYSIIGYDRQVKSIVIQIPKEEKETIRQTINSKIPNHKFIVFDDEVYSNSGIVSSVPDSDRGWHLNAIHLKQGWTFTKGSPNIKVAIVDDGIDASHSMFKDRIVEAYNVFTQNNRLSLGEGHGTHVAGIAAGSDRYYDKGASGVAPNCKIMPIQVFDNGICSLSSLISGIMYAIHHNADVINASIAPSFEGLNQLVPPQAQQQIAEQSFKNQERLWLRISKIASNKKIILILAAGNDNILASIPAENRNLFSMDIGAVDKNIQPTTFTNYGGFVDLSAPGQGIYSAYTGNSFKMMDGTSMAAPIVSGTIALMKSLDKNLTIEQIRNVLYRTGVKVQGNLPPMILVDKALQAVKTRDFSAPKDRTQHRVTESNNNILQQPTNDYESIRRQIEEYKKKIQELERLLPHN